jgi:hypothetical protein
MEHSAYYRKGREVEEECRITQLAGRLEKLTIRVFETLIAPAIWNSASSARSYKPIFSTLTIISNPNRTGH